MATIDPNAAAQTEPTEPDDLTPTDPQDLTPAEAWAALAALIDAHGITMEATVDPHPTGWAAGKGATDPRRPFAFLVILETSSHWLETPYSTGCANPIREWQQSGKDLRGGWSGEVPLKLPSPHARGWTLDEAEAVEALRKVYRPTVVDVMGCLLMDSTYFDPSDTFREWIDNSGLNWPHPADAVEAFKAIRRSDAFLRRALGTDYQRAIDLAGAL